MYPEAAGSSFDFNSPEYLQWQCDIYNELQGHLNESDGYNCDICKNKGQIAIISDDTVINRPCKCTPIRDSLKILRESGLANCTFDNFNCGEKWQEKLLETGRNFVETTRGEWLFIGGQSGSGKTHICTAVLRSLVFRYRIKVELFKWAEDSKRLKQLVNDPAYTEAMNVYKTPKVLYIDDFFKIKRGENVTAADVNLAFELLDYRYCNKLLTIISSELSLDEIVDIDEAIGGRITQRSGRFELYISKDRKRNYRLKPIRSESEARENGGQTLY